MEKENTQSKNKKRSSPYVHLLASKEANMLQKMCSIVCLGQLPGSVSLFEPLGDFGLPHSGSGDEELIKVRVGGGHGAAATGASRVSSGLLQPVLAHGCCLCLLFVHLD